MIHNPMYIWVLISALGPCHKTMIHQRYKNIEWSKCLGLELTLVKVNVCFFFGGGGERGKRMHLKHLVLPKAMCHSVFPLEGNMLQAIRADSIL